VIALANFKRRQQPPSFDDYRRYRPYLEIDFRRQCCYCGMQEAPEHPGSFAVEHFRPKEKFPDLKCSYSNLYYACFRCNRFKWDHWPSGAEVQDGRRFWDPCADVSVEHFYCTFTDGAIHPRTKCGDYTREKVRLDRPFLRTLRLKRIERHRRFREICALLRGIRAVIDNRAACPEKQLLERIIETLSIELRGLRPRAVRT
jgi:uncharacterized protein (TIGR02646 family)